MISDWEIAFGASLRPAERTSLSSSCWGWALLAGELSPERGSSPPVRRSEFNVSTSPAKCNSESELSRGKESAISKLLYVMRPRIPAREVKSRAAAAAVIFLEGRRIRRIDALLFAERTLSMRRWSKEYVDGCSASSERASDTRESVFLSSSSSLRQASLFSSCRSTSARPSSERLSNR